MMRTAEQKKEARAKRKANKIAMAMAKYQAACEISKVLMEHDLLKVAGVTSALAILTTKPTTRTEASISMVGLMFGKARISEVPVGATSSVKAVVMATVDEDGLPKVSKKDVTTRWVSRFKRKGYGLTVEGDVITYTGPITNPEE